MNSIETRKILLTREELYARVWAVPLLQLAREFGISDVALGRMCRRRNIPCPPPGYWAKRRAGRPLPRPLLPPPQGKISRPALFTISSSPGTAPAPLATAQPEKNRFSLDQLFALAAEWERRDRVQRYLEACERQWQRDGTLTPPRRAWLAWARRELSQLPCGLASETSSFAAESTFSRGQNWTAVSA